MPELPEVETIKLGLQKKIVGKVIKDIEVRYPKIFRGEKKEILGAKVICIERFAKNLVINLSNKKSLIFHLKMTGQLIYVDDKQRFIGGHPTPDMRLEMPNKHSHAIFTFNDGSVLYFNDQRKFGWVKLTDNVKKELGVLGPEPLEKEFSVDVMKTNLLRHKTLPIKVAILDQQAIAGIGNIYASEACFNAKLDPTKKVSELTDKEFESLHRGVLKALRDGIKHGGSSKTHFVNAEGKKGYFLDYAFVYGKDGDKCKVCGTIIRKIQLRGRGTYLCPSCQS